MVPAGGRWRQASALAISGGGPLIQDLGHSRARHRCERPRLRMRQPRRCWQRRPWAGRQRPALGWRGPGHHPCSGRLAWTRVIAGRAGVRAGTGGLGWPQGLAWTGGLGWTGVLGRTGVLARAGVVPRIGMVAGARMLARISMCVCPRSQTVRSRTRGWVLRVGPWRQTRVVRDRVWRRRRVDTEPARIWGGWADGESGCVQWLLGPGSRARIIRRGG